MKNIHEFNEYALDKLRKVEGIEQLSNPLLISPKCKGKIMYIGQETNCWYGALSESDYDAIKLEEFYYEKFSQSKFKNTLFWKFIRQSCGKYNIFGDVIWTNTLISGKKDSIGKPVNNDKIMDISIENLIAIYECFDIEKIICVAGPNNPYYEIFTKFIEYVGKSINGYPKKSNFIVYSDDEDAVYLYHPQYLWQSHRYDEAVGKLKEFIKK